MLSDFSVEKLNTIGYVQNIRVYMEWESKEVSPGNCLLVCPTSIARVLSLRCQKYQQMKTRFLI